MFVLSAGLASISGSLMVHYLRVMEPNIFGFQFSLMIITAAVLGGLQSVWGGVLGAAATVAMKEVLHGLGLPLLEVIIMGALTVAALILAPNGLAGALSKLLRARASLKRGAPSSRPFFYSIEAADASHKELLEIANVSKLFGSLAAVSEVTFAVKAQSITALIGPNGAGKTSLFNLIAGSLAIDFGDIIFQGRKTNELEASGLATLGIARTFQQVQLFEHLNVRENVMCGRHRLGRITVFDIAFRPWRKRHEEHAIRLVADAALEFLGLTAVADLRPSELSFGQQRKIEIARALASEPIMLLMDEPASGLNDWETEELADLIARIRAFGTTILLVEHDMRLVMGLSDHVVVMHHGRMLAQGDPTHIRADPEVISAYLGSA
jgi:branched-chain amino acid transport system permease protein